MAFVNTESKGVDYRVVLTSHNLVVDASQLPAEVDAVLFEGLGETPDILRCLVTGRGFRLLTGNQQHYREIVKVVRSKPNILVGLAEPILNSTYAQETENLQIESKQANSDTIELDGDITDMLLAAAMTSEEIDRRSGIFDAFSTLTTYFLQQEDLAEVELRNLLMAQRASSLGSLLKKAGKCRPSITLATGVAHIGAVGALELDEHERVARILRDPLLPQIFDTDHLNLGVLARYNPTSRRWSPMGFQDRALQVACPSA